MAISWAHSHNANMALPEVWLSMPDLADLATISRRAALKAAAKAMEGRHWRGHALVVREKSGSRGGRSGVRYEVLLSSLPEELQRAFNANSTPATLPMLPTPEAPYRPSMLAKPEYAPKALAAHKLIEPALHHPAHSPARRAAMEIIAKQAGCSTRTIARQIERFEKHGLSGLVRKAHSNAGQRRVHISRAFDKAYNKAGYDLSLLPQMSDDLDLWIKSFWASRAADAGAPDVAKGALWEFRKKWEAQGIVLPKEAYKIGPQRVKKWRVYKEVHLMRTAGMDKAERTAFVRTLKASTAGCKVATRNLSAYRQSAEIAPDNRKAR